MPGALSPYPLVVPEGAPEARAVGGGGRGPPFLQPRWGTIHSLGRLVLGPGWSDVQSHRPKASPGAAAAAAGGTARGSPRHSGNKCLMQVPPPLIVGRRGCLAGSCDPRFLFKPCSRDLRAAEALPGVGSGQQRLYVCKEDRAVHPIQVFCHWESPDGQAEVPGVYVDAGALG